jgi:hypothetical protein
VVVEVVQAIQIRLAVRAVVVQERPVVMDSQHLKWLVRLVLQILAVVVGEVATILLEL